MNTSNTAEEKFGMARLLLFNQLIDLRPQERELREKVNTAKNEKQKDTFLKALTNVQKWIKEISEAYDLLGKSAPNTVSTETATELMIEVNKEVQGVAETLQLDDYAKDLLHENMDMAFNEWKRKEANKPTPKMAEDVEKLAEQILEKNKTKARPRGLYRETAIAAMIEMYNLGKASIQQH
jgi:hypothetical protein